MNSATKTILQIGTTSLEPRFMDAVDSMDKLELNSYSRAC